MAKIYADRAFLEINGVEILDIESIDYDINENLTRVETMTRNRRSAGFRKGNKAINLSTTLAVETDRPQLNLALKDPAATMNLVIEMGGERLSFIDCEQSQQTGSGTVGNANKTLNLEAIDFVDENGRSRLSELQLG
jgi:hypothetical protein